MTLAGTRVNIQSVYDNGLYDPTQDPATTLDVLNGDLDSANQEVATDYVPTWAIQPGALVAGVSMPFDRWEYVYGPQLGGQTGGSQPDLAVPIAGLCARVFIPWDASLILMGYQAFLQHDARGVADGENVSVTQDQLEYWSLFFAVNGSGVAALTAVLPYGAYQNSNDEDGVFMNENRWRFVSKTHAITSGAALNKGYLSFKVSAFGFLFEDDKWKSKLKIPSGSLWLMAFR
jgi:hypothetical protein